METTYFIVLNLLSVFIASCTQVILKKSAATRPANTLNYFLNPATITAYTLFFGCCLLTFYCLSHLEMITTNVLECSAYVYILILDKIFFHKKITWKKLLGNALIITGIIICLCR